MDAEGNAAASAADSTAPAPAPAPAAAATTASTIGTGGTVTPIASATTTATHTTTAGNQTQLSGVPGAAAAALPDSGADAAPKPVRPSEAVLQHLPKPGGGDADADADSTQQQTAALVRRPRAEWTALVRRKLGACWDQISAVDRAGYFALPVAEVVDDDILAVYVRSFLPLRSVLVPVMVVMVARACDW